MVGIAILIFLIVVICSIVCFGEKQNPKYRIVVKNDYYYPQKLFQRDEFHVWENIIKCTRRGGPEFCVEYVSFTNLKDAENYVEGLIEKQKTATEKVVKYY